MGVHKKIQHPETPYARHHIRCCRIKSQDYANGWKQGNVTPNYDTNTPTVATETLMLFCLICAIKERDVPKVDIRGAVVQAEIDKVVISYLLDPNSDYS
eukprot:8116845-Ditylum_brightwellii.AAC.1